MRLVDRYSEVRKRCPDSGRSARVDRRATDSSDSNGVVGESRTRAIPSVHADGSSRSPWMKRWRPDGTEVDETAAPRRRRRTSGGRDRSAAGGNPPAESAVLGVPACITVPRARPSSGTRRNYSDTDVTSSRTRSGTVVDDARCVRSDSVRRCRIVWGDHRTARRSEPDGSVPADGGIAAHASTRWFILPPGEVRRMGQVTTRTTTRRVVVAVAEHSRRVGGDE